MIEHPAVSTVCPCCEKPASDVERRRRNTAYVDEESNWLTACGECQREDDEYFQERWDEYWAGRL